MKPLSIKVHISKPCNENWGAMLPNEQGRFCLSCHKTVVDFTTKTDAEIVAFFTQNPYGCGRFSRNQVLMDYELPKTRWQKWREYMAAASLVLGTKLAVLTPALAQTAASPAKSGIRMQAAVNPEPVVSADGNIHFKGIVLNPLDEKPLAGVAVRLQIQSLYEDNRQRNFYFSDAGPRTTTDPSGKFELVVPAVELGAHEYYLHFYASGYSEDRLKLTMDAPQPLVHYLKKFDRNDYRDRSGIVDVMGGGPSMHQTYKSRTPKPYRTKAGFVIAKLTYPVGKLVDVLQEKIRYALYS